MGSVLERAASGALAFHDAVNTGEMNDDKSGLGQFADSAGDLRTPASMAVGFSAVRRSSETAQLVTPYVVVN